MGLTTGPRLIALILAVCISWSSKREREASGIMRLAKRECRFVPSLKLSVEA
jgi:hypothetical protein